ncbi:MAG TPA: YHS domain-containing protein, partial [Pseudomonadales bacterium]|nr:YHS domain-containing protein [Pseudomonadales bacterium]
MNTLHSPAPSPADASAHCSHGHAAATFIDPVCGMTVKPESPHHAVHAGREYRFCSAGCRGKFVADPARWLEPRDPEPATALPGATYTCPMHPEIIRDHPSSCP